MKKYRSAAIAALLLATFCWVSCGVKSSYYQKQVPVPKAQWAASFRPVFRIEVKDTTARCRFYFLLRHDESYPNSNIWFRLSVKAPGDSLFRDGGRIQADLADASGVWLGRGMGGIWEHKVPVRDAEAPRLNRPGVYEIRMEQLMRQDPLPSVLNVGLLIEQVRPVPIKKG